MSITSNRIELIEMWNRELDYQFGKRNLRQVQISANEALESEFGIRNASIKNAQFHVIETLDELISLSCKRMQAIDGLLTNLVSTEHLHKDITVKDIRNTNSY